MDIKNIIGLRFPDDYLVRMFFKFGLEHGEGKRVLEFGCGNGNNLLLFQEYGWNVSGIDIDEGQLKNARANLGNDHVEQLISVNLSSTIPKIDGLFDAILFPNVNYYLPRQSFEKLLAETSNLMADGCAFFLRGRTPHDWRYGKGKEVEKNGFILNRNETDEEGLLNVFYEPDELANILLKYLGRLRDYQKLTSSCDNLQNNIVINNSDVIFWGRR